MQKVKHLYRKIVVPLQHDSESHCENNNNIKGNNYERLCI